MTILARLIILAHLMSSTISYAGAAEQSAFGSKADSMFRATTPYSTSDISTIYCFDSANLYLFADGNRVIHYLIMPNDSVLRSCVVYRGDSATYYVMYTVGDRVGIDYATYHNGAYRSAYRTIERSIPVSE